MLQDAKKKGTARRPAAPARKPGAGKAASLRGEFVYSALRDEIRAGHLNPGDRLRETEIAERLGVSRTPVREALKRLEADGVVMFGQPRGLTVTKLGHSQILQLYAMREVLEGAAARFAAERATAIEVDALKHILAQDVRKLSPAAVAAANRALHEGIVAAAHNEYLSRAIAVLTDALALLGTTTYAVPGRIESGWQENAEIVARIERRDADGAEAAARRHIRAAAAVRIAMSAKS